MPVCKEYENVLFKTVDDCLDSSIEIQHLLMRNIAFKNTNTFIALCRDCIDLCPMFSAFVIRESQYTFEIGQTLREICLLLNVELQKLDLRNNQIKQSTEIFEQCANAIEHCFNHSETLHETKKYKTA